MATIVLSAVGAAAGASVGGGVLGLSSVVIGRAVGATVGRAIDQRILGGGSEKVETGKTDRFRLTGASEGSVIPQIYWRMRVPGQVIWSSRFKEITTTSGGGKGQPASPTVTEYSYSVSMAIALCEGEITRVGRVWADGKEIPRGDLNMRIYKGTETQMPDPKIEAVEGAGNVPAFRGVAYVVFEDLPLGQFGNRVPQFSFEVMRPAKPTAGTALDLAHGVRGVALIPGTGEYALATAPVHLEYGPGDIVPVNVNSPSGQTDFVTSIEALDEELPNCGAVSLVVSWFGDDLRCTQTNIRPKVEQVTADGKKMPWRVSGETRSTAWQVPISDGRPVYGGTPTDQSVVQAIQNIRSKGKDVTFYPFILMEQLAGNILPDPWTGNAHQPQLPWRGRITLSEAPGQGGSPDQTVAAEAEVSAFFGNAHVSDFTTSAASVSYNGPDEWSYRRFVLHYAHLCAAAGGVDAFCIGSEMRGLTQIRGAAGNFPAVEAMQELAADVRSILGASVKIGYAADWSEYFGYHPQDGSGDVLFHLDPLWADGNIDFIGIDNYMPMSDWRDGNDHADADWGSIYNVEYLKANIAGGEGFDWYYSNETDELSQTRSPISDGAHGEPWVYRYKDLKGWWSNPHHDRISGVRSATPTSWEPGSKPFWFTEFGCAAVDKGTNQPNKFLDPKSSESSLPKYSDGRRDDLIQMQYLRAMFDHWADADNNPVSNVYDGPMVDMTKAHVWSWDARPYPFFPANRNIWSDGGNYFRGHCLNGRTTSRSLADVVTEICERSGVYNIDVSQLYGYLRGFVVSDVSGARPALQQLMLAYGFDAVERDGKLIFRSRDGRATAAFSADQFALSEDIVNTIEHTRLPEAETIGRVRLNYVVSDGDYDLRSDEALFPDEAHQSVSQTEVPLLLTETEARATVERWLSEARVARDGVRFNLPPSRLHVGAGDVVALDNGTGTSNFRIDRVSNDGALQAEAVRVEAEVYDASVEVDAPINVRAFERPTPVSSIFLDLPLLGGSEVPHAPHIAATSKTWPGTAAVFSASSDSGYQLNTLIQRAAIVGVTESVLPQSPPGLVDRGPALRVRLVSGAMSSVSLTDMLNGANAAAIGDGSVDNWEVFQFERADLVGTNTYDLTQRLRGQAGTDALPSIAWPPGSTFVLLDGAPKQIELATSARGLARHYRFGPARRSYDDPSYTHEVHAFDGVGLRPLAPVHLRSVQDGSGGHQVSWIRRTRIDGDNWASVDVPLGEDSESYLVRVVQGSAIKREAMTTNSSWTYSDAMKVSDGVSGLFFIDVAQISSRFGPGLFRRIDVNE